MPSFSSFLCVCDTCTHVCVSAYPCEEKDRGDIRYPALSLSAVFPRDSLSPNLEPGRQPASPRYFPVPHTSGVMGKREQHPTFVSLILMFELRSSCLQLLFFYFDWGLANFYYSCFGGWMVCVQLFSSSTSSIWTQPLTTDKWLGLCAIIFYFQTPIFGF